MKPIAVLTAVALVHSPSLALGSSAKPTNTVDRAFLVRAWKQGMAITLQRTDRNHDGVISHDEAADPRAKDFFRTYDLDHDGSVSLQELCHPRFQEPWVAHLESDAATYFRALDANRDGQIDPIEIAKLSLYTTQGLMPKQEALRAEVFKQASASHSGLTSRDFERYLGRLFGRGIGWGLSDQTAP